jgi:TatD DNase family protein
VSTVRLWDTHGHLQDPAFDGDREDAYARTAAAQIGVIIPGYSLASSEAARALAARWPLARAQVGVHPHEVAHLPDDWLEQLERWAGDPAVVAVGEIGLDYYRDLSPRPDQRRAFDAQLRLARRLDLPVAVHVRDAFEDAIEAIRSVSGVRGVLHCFTGDRSHARALLDLGFYLSFAGPVTFRSGESLRDVVRWAPRDRVLVETDSPYMAPVPHRGHRNEPRWVEDTAAVVVDLMGLAQDTGFPLLVHNTERAFDRLGAL